MRRTRVLWVVALVQALVSIDSTVMNVALPTMQAELNFADSARHWVITAYALTFGALLLAGARVGSRLGTRRALMWGGLLFAGASLVGGVAWSFEIVVAGRVLQGAAAALIAPAALTALNAAYPSGGPRIQAFGIYGAVGVVGTAAGLLLGGPLTQFLTWRSPLILLAALAVIAMVGAMTALAEPETIHTRSLAWPSVVLSTTALFTMVLSLSLFETGEHLVAVSLLVGGVVAFASFTLVERRQEDPLLPTQMFSNRSRVGGLAGLGLGAAGLFSVFLFVVYFLQGPLQLDPVMSSLAILPFPVIAMASSLLLAPRLIRVMGSSAALVSAAVLAAAGMGWMAAGTHTASYLGTLLPGILGVAAGMGVIFTIAPDIATTGLSRNDQDSGSSLVHVVQQIGGAVGIAVLTFISSLSGNSDATGYQLVFAVTAGIFLCAGITASLAFWLPTAALRRKSPTRTRIRRS